MNQIDAVLSNGENGPVANFGGQSLALAPLVVLQNSVGKPIIVGIRPENVTVHHDTVPGQINIDVDLIETLGSEALVHATLANEPFVIKTETGTDSRRLEKITGFTIAPDRIKLFDAKSGNVLAGQASGR